MFEKMPKLPGDDQKFVHKKSKEYIASKHGMEPQTEKLIEAGREVVGSGSESVVEVHPNNPEKVVAHSFRHEGPRMRRIFYNHRILHTLFPNFFPEINAAFEHTDYTRGGTIRERVDILMDAPDDPTLPVTPKSFENVRRELDAIGISTTGFDTGSDKNFGIAWDGFEQYLDVNPTIGKHFIAEKDAVIRYMKQKNYSEADIEKVISAINRLEVLEKQAKDAGEDQRLLK
jgi:hypothetical protein